MEQCCDHKQKCVKKLTDAGCEDDHAYYTIFEGIETYKSNTLVSAIKVWHRINGSRLNHMHSITVLLSKRVRSTDSCL